MGGGELSTKIQNESPTRFMSQEEKSYRSIKIIYFKSQYKLKPGNKWPSWNSILWHSKCTVIQTAILKKKVLNVFCFKTNKTINEQKFRATIYLKHTLHTSQTHLKIIQCKSCMENGNFCLPKKKYLYLEDINYKIINPWTSVEWKLLWLQYRLR